MGGQQIKWRFELVKAGLFGAVGAVLTLGFTGTTLDDLDWKAKRVYSVHAATQPSVLVQNIPNPTDAVGLPIQNKLRVFDGYVCAYDRRNRIPLWVMEHLTPSKLDVLDGKRVPEDRKQFDFYEDLGEMALFRSSNKDYLGSGYDRGHMAAAGNHRFERSAMAQTFILSNIAPQVGVGFNRHAWNDLEMYVRAIARRSTNVVVVTGPLFLPRLNGTKKEVCYEVIGPNNVAVPTHFFKAVAIQERMEGSWRLISWVLPNVQLPEKVNLNEFQVPITAVERSSGLHLFPNVPER